MTIEELKVLITAETSGLQKEIKKVQNQLNSLDKTTTKATSRIGNAFKKIGKAVGIATITTALVKLGKSAVEASSNLVEVQNMVDVAFGDAASKVDKFAKTAVDRFGITEYAAKKMASQFMAMGNSMGITNRNANIMSVQLTGLAADLASFFNTSVETAQNALEGVYTGQTKALRQFGIVVDEATLQEYALAQGITKAVRTMNAAEQATLRYNYVLQQTTQAQNDFARTSGTWANQIRLLRQQWNAFMTELGSVITVVLIPIVRWLNTILAYLAAVVRAFKSVFGIGSSSMDDTAKSTDKLATSIGGVSDNLGGATKKAKELKKTIAGFDELEILNAPADDSGSGSGASGGGGGGYDVGTYFDPEDWKVEGLEDFEKEAAKTIAILKDFVDYVLGPVAKAFKALTDYIKPVINANGDRAWDWKHILNLVGLVAAIGFIGKKLIGGIKTIFGSLKNVNGLNFFEKLWIGIKFGLFTVEQAFKRFVSALGTILKPIASFISKWVLQPVLHPIATLKTLWGVAKGVFGDIALWVKSTGQVIMMYIKSPMTLLKDAWLGIQNLLKTVGGVFKNLWSVIAAHPLAALLSVLALVALAMVDQYNKSEAFRKKLDELYRNVILPVINYVKDQAITVWNNALKPLWTNVTTMITNLITLVKTIWDLISQALAWLGLNLVPPITMWVGEVIAVITRLVGNVAEVVNGIITAVNGIIVFLTGVFTGNWRQAWEGVKQIFSGIWNGLVGIAKGPLNLIIGLVNRALAVMEGALNSVGRALNKLKITIPAWVPIFGGRTYGFNISTVSLTRVPYLADGGVLTQDTTARLAEYANAHNNPEIVTPENLMRDIFTESQDDLVVLLDRNNRLLEQILEKNVSITIGDDVISASAARGAKDYKKRTGMNQFA